MMTSTPRVIHGDYDPASRQREELEVALVKLDVICINAD